MTKPISVVERPISADDKRILAEYEAIQHGVGSLTLAWAHVESQLVQILAAIINNPTYEIASAIYFAPFGIDARLKIVDGAFTAFIVPEPFKGTLRLEWKAEMNCLRHLKGTRNKAAHGELALHSGRRGKAHYRLTWPLFAFDEGEIEAVLNDQLPGMGSNELRQSQHAVEEAAKRLGKFTRYVRLVRQGKLSTLQRKLDEAIARNPNRHRPDSRNSSKDELPPPPCPE